MEVHLQASINGKKTYYCRVGTNGKVIMTENKDSANPISKHLVPGIITKLMGQYTQVSDIELLF